MSDIPSDLIDKMMVNCGRRCCICKQFRPTKLQVHHIHEKANGGTDDEDNLIVTCFSCHSDIHTKVPFARRFSENEQKGHRDALIKQVAERILPVEDTDDRDDAIRVLLQALYSAPKPPTDLLPEAAEILLLAVKAEPHMGQGAIVTVRGSEGFSLVVGGGDMMTDCQDKRKAAAYRHALQQLESGRLVENVSNRLYEVTHSGYLIADEIAARGTQALTE